MKYAHLLNYVGRTPWAILPEKMTEILSVLAFRASGQSFTREEIQARIGTPDSAAAQPRNQGSVAVIPVRGVIAARMGGMDDMSGGTSAERVSAMIDRVATDPSIGTIVYDFDTPGGTVPGVMETAAKMFALRGQKRQIAMVNNLAASAGYWLAAQADEIVVTPSGSAGSIGIFTVLQDLTEALAKEGIKTEILRAGKYKAEANPFEPLSDDGRAFIQARVDEAYAQLVKDVARGRGVSPSAVRNGYGEGRVLSAKDAKAAGLVDRIATMDETLARLAGGGRSRSGMRAELDQASNTAALNGGTSTYTVQDVSADDFADANREDECLGAGSALLARLPLYTGTLDSVQAITLHRDADGRTSLVGNWPERIAITAELLNDGDSYALAVTGRDITIALRNASATYEAIGRYDGTVVANRAAWRIDTLIADRDRRIRLL